MRDWEEKAEFMRSVGATEARWETQYVNGAPKTKLVHLVLGAAPRPGPAAQMKDFHERVHRSAVSDAERQHNILFAASSVRPRMADMTPPNAVPRAERAKRDAQRGTTRTG